MSSLGSSVPPTAPDGAGVFAAGSRVELPGLGIAPGAALAAAIEALVLEDLTAGATVEVVAATQRLIRWAHGMQMRALAEYDRFQVWSKDPKRPKGGDRGKHYGADDLEALSEFADREIGCALGVAPVTAGVKMGMAQDLADRLPLVRAAMLDGTLDEFKARAIVSATRVLNATDAAVVEAQILPVAAKISQRRLKSELDRLVIAADPQGAAARHRAARRERRCSMVPGDDGMGWFHANLSADGLAQVWKALDARAWAGKHLITVTHKDDQTIDQRRADALVAICAESLDQSLAGRFPGMGMRVPMPAWPEQPEDDESDPWANAPAKTGANTTADAATADDDPADGQAPSAPAAHAPAEAASDCAAVPPANHDAADGSTSAPDDPDAGWTYRRVVVPPVPHPRTADDVVAPLTESPASPQSASPPGEAGAEVDDAVVKRVRSVIARRCTINVHLGADVLLGTTDSPAYLTGYGWIPAPAARRLLSADAVLRRIVDDPVTGEVLNVSRKTYRPTPEMLETVRVRDQICTFPLCDKPAMDCQVDHTRPHPKGRTGRPRDGDSDKTTVGGLGSLCDTEHRLKTHGGWQVHKLLDRWEWVSPTGKVYTTAGPTYTPRTLAELEAAERVQADLDAVANGTADDATIARVTHRDALAVARRDAIANEPAPF